MIEYLDPINAVNASGDVVPRDDIVEKDPFGEDTPDVFIPTMAFSSLVLARSRKRLEALVEHPSMAGESLDKMKETSLGGKAQSLLDDYITERDRLAQLGAPDRRPRLHLMQALARSQADRTITADEAQAILAQIKTDLPHQKDDTVVELRPSTGTRHEYRDVRSAAANDYDD